jgi:hypothetical protein
MVLPKIFSIIIASFPFHQRMLSVNKHHTEITTYEQGSSSTPIVSMERSSNHPSDTLNLEDNPGIFKNLWAPGLG